MRGKVTVLVFGSMILRITPAYAGKSGSALMQNKATARITPAYAGKSRPHRG